MRKYPASGTFCNRAWRSRGFYPFARSVGASSASAAARSAMISTLLNTAAGSHRFLAFGDSWAWLGFDQFKAALAPHSINASRHAIPGTPAGYWAWAQPEALVNAVDATNADAVYLSIGGNDFLEGLPAGHHAETLFEEMMASTRLVLTRLFEQRPHVHVFHFGYELLDWGSCRVYLVVFADSHLFFFLIKAFFHLTGQPFFQMNS